MTAGIYFAGLVADGTLAASNLIEPLEFLDVYSSLYQVLNRGIKSFAS